MHIWVMLARKPRLRIAKGDAASFYAPNAASSPPVLPPLVVRKCLGESVPSIAIPPPRQPCEVRADHQDRGDGDDNGQDTMLVRRS